MTGRDAIPEMTDPLGKHWHQPLREQIVFNRHGTAMMAQGDIERLLEYSSSIPTGVYPGKMWKRRADDGVAWLLCWYGEEDAEGRCPILWRPII